VGKKKGRSLKDQAWVEAKKRHRLAVRHVKMAREIGLNPKKLGKIDNHKQEQWKMPLRQYIEHLYGKRFGEKKLKEIMGTRSSGMSKGPGCVGKQPSSGFEPSPAVSAQGAWDEDDLPF
jgi:hypothetical protein